MLRESDYIVLPPLSTNEIRLGAFHAIDRRTHNMAHRQIDRSHDLNYSWTEEVESVCAEMAVSKWRNIYWTGLMAKRAKDCGQDDVRYTKHYGTGGLIVYPHEADTLPIILVDGFSTDQFRIIGWAAAGEAKQQNWWDSKRSYWLMPRQYLRPPQKKANDLQMPLALS
jgi:hypothetical protein